MDGRSLRRAAGTCGKRYKQGWADGQADGSNRAKNGSCDLKPKTIGDGREGERTTRYLAAGGLVSFKCKICWSFITSQPTPSVGGPDSWCALASVVVCNTPQRRICNVTHQGAARDGGPVVWHPVRATPCLLLISTWTSLCSFLSQFGLKMPAEIHLRQVYI